MTIGTIDESQRKAATVVGLSYLFALPPAIFAEFYVRTRLIAFDNTAQTARNIMAHERLFRLGTASNLTVFAVDVVLIIALYVVLMPVNRRVALLAMGWGLIETASLVVVTFSDFDVLRILSGADYLHAFQANQLQALARLSLGAHGAAYNVGLVLAGLRSTAFCYLWFKSHFIPRALAAWGMFASFLMGACAFSFIIFPELTKVVAVEIYGAPIFFFELTMGFWLLIRGLPPSGAAPDRVSGSAQAGAV
ncbi:MAG TPA: DUF4386 domain-containing protein [Gemmatimonadaceae bacterium]|nr:DUF4386 domain-containing protein [Gemmatimonadaceae bacterium]